MSSLLDLTTNITPEKAYFLGAILVANENYQVNGRKIWLAPIRHNPGQITEHELRQHYAFLKILSDKVNGEIILAEQLGSSMGFSAGKKGFAICFYSNSEIELSLILNRIGNITQESMNIKRAFLIGAFDGRSSFDRNSTTGIIRNIAVDCEDRNIHEIISNLLSCFDIQSLNQNVSRERIAGGKPRKNQLRIPQRYIDNFATKIGFISPLRFKIFKQCFTADIPYIKNEDSFLAGLKSLSRVQTDVFYEENEQDEIVISKTNNLHIEPTINQYLGSPRSKSVPIFSKGRKIYCRNPQIAVNALAIANYKCEIDDEHYTFIRRKNNNPYTEPHHLIPMAFSDRFDVSLDVEENIVSLCSNCHNLLHYGRDAKDLIILLFDKRKELLRRVGINVDIEDLYEMYKLD